MQAADEAQLTREAKIFTRYLIGEDADALTIELYTSVNNVHSVVLTKKETKRLEFILNNTWAIAMVDSVLALTAPDGGIRKKLYLLFAILESNPVYTKHFLPSEQVKLPSVIVTGIKAAFNTVTGFILLPWI